MIPDHRDFVLTAITKVVLASTGEFAAIQIALFQRDCRPFTPILSL